MDGIARNARNTTTGVQSDATESRKAELNRTDFDGTQKIEATDNDQTEHILSGTDINKFVNFTLKNGNLFKRVEIVAGHSGESSPGSQHRTITGPLPPETQHTLDLVYQPISNNTINLTKGYEQHSESAQGMPRIRSKDFDSNERFEIMKIEKIVEEGSNLNDGVLAQINENCSKNRPDKSINLMAKLKQSRTIKRPQTSKQIKSLQSRDNNKIVITDESKGRSSAGKLLAVDEDEKNSAKRRNLAVFAGNSSSQSQGHLKKARASLKPKLQINNNGISSQKSLRSSKVDMLNEMSIKTNSRRRLKGQRDRSNSASNQDLVMIEDNQSNKPTIVASRSKTGGRASLPNDDYNDIDSQLLKEQGKDSSTVLFNQQTMQTVGELPPANAASDIKSKTDRADRHKRQSRSILDQRSSLDQKRESGTTSRSRAVPLKTAELMTSLHDSQRRATENQFQLQIVQPASDVELQATKSLDTATAVDIPKMKEKLPQGSYLVPKCFKQFDKRIRCKSGRSGAKLGAHRSHSHKWNQFGRWRPRPVSRDTLVDSKKKTILIQNILERTANEDHNHHYQAPAQVWHQKSARRFNIDDIISDKSNEMGKLRGSMIKSGPSTPMSRQTRGSRHSPNNRLVHQAQFGSTVGPVSPTDILQGHALFPLRESHSPLPQKVTSPFATRNRALLDQGATPTLLSLLTSPEMVENYATEKKDGDDAVLPLQIPSPSQSRQQSNKHQSNQNLLRGSNTSAIQKPSQRDKQLTKNDESNLQNQQLSKQAQLRQSLQPKPRLNGPLVYLASEQRHLGGKYLKMKRPLSHNATSRQRNDAENASTVGNAGVKTQTTLLEEKDLLDHEFDQYNQRRNVDTAKSQAFKDILKQGKMKSSRTGSKKEIYGKMHSQRVKNPNMDDVQKSINQLSVDGSDVDEAARLAGQHIDLRISSQSQPYYQDLVPEQSIVSPQVYQPKLRESHEFQVPEFKPIATHLVYRSADTQDSQKRTPVYSTLSNQNAGNANGQPGDGTSNKEPELISLKSISDDFDPNAYSSQQIPKQEMIILEEGQFVDLDTQKAIADERIKRDILLNETKKVKANGMMGEQSIDGAVCEFMKFKKMQLRRYIRSRRKEEGTKWHRRDNALRMSQPLNIRKVPQKSLKQDAFVGIASASGIMSNKQSKSSHHRNLHHDDSDAHQEKMTAQKPLLLLNKSSRMQPRSKNVTSLNYSKQYEPSECPTNTNMHITAHSLQNASLAKPEIAMIENYKLAMAETVDVQEFAAGLAQQNTTYCTNEVPNMPTAMRSSFDKQTIDKVNHQSIRTSIQRNDQNNSSLMQAVRQSLRWSQNNRDNRPKSDMMLVNGNLVHVVPIPKQPKVIPEQYKKYVCNGVESAHGDARPATAVETAAQGSGNFNSVMTTISKNQMGVNPKVEHYLNVQINESDRLAHDNLRYYDTDVLGDIEVGPQARPLTAVQSRHGPRSIDPDVSRGNNRVRTISANNTNTTTQRNQRRLQRSKGSSAILKRVNLGADQYEEQPFALKDVECSITNPMRTFYRKAVPFQKGKVNYMQA